MARLHSSSTIARITGWPGEKLDAPGSFTAIIEDEFCKIRLQFERNILQADQTAIECPVLSRNGEAIWVRGDCHVVKRLQDGRSEVVGMITGITAELHLKEQALPTAKLATLDEMAAGVGSELNQPCATITLAADLVALELSRGGAERIASVQRRVDETARQTVRLRDIIRPFPDLFPQG